MNDAEGDHRGGISTFENVTYAHMCVNGNTGNVMHVGYSTLTVLFGISHLAYSRPFVRIIVNIIFSGYFKYHFTYHHFFFTVKSPCHTALPDPKSS